jgi:hypothetical protein
LGAKGGAGSPGIALKTFLALPSKGESGTPCGNRRANGAKGWTTGARCMGGAMVIGLPLAPLLLRSGRWMIQYFGASSGPKASSSATRSLRSTGAMQALGRVRSGPGGPRHSVLAEKTISRERSPASALRDGCRRSWSPAMRNRSRRQ